MIRLFVAIALPEMLRHRLAMLCRGVKGARWADESNMHLTLRFIGEVEEPQAEDVAAALDRLRAPCFPLSLAGAGHFETRGRVRQLWIGIEPNPALVRLQERIESALQREGLEPERRRFSPHITLARLDRAAPDVIRNWLHENSLFRAEPFAVEEFVLFQSLQGNGGAVYHAVAEYPLGDAVEP